MTAPHKPGIIILQTKLNRPSVTRDLVVRPRLLKQLNVGLEGAITLVIAPAGFGKTTLVSSWLQAANGTDGISLPATWLSLDEEDSDRDVFLRYFIAALRVIFPEACPETLKLINSRQQPPTKVLMDTLSNEIETLPSRFVVVMDDLHVPHGRALFEHVNEWLHHWPRQMHLVILSRFNPPLPLTSLRANGLLTEIRSRDLRFTQTEMVEYFNQFLPIAPDEPAALLLQQRLEGWIAGLKMALLSLGDPESVQDLVAVLGDQEVFITDYLVNEVIAGQPPEIQRFLLKTSILDQVSASLAETLMDDQDADCNVRDCIDYLESADLFLIFLDNQREWYRYHHLFRDVLRQKLPILMSAAQIEGMHIRAADWYFAHGLPDRAIDHALEAKNLELAASYMEQGLRDALNDEDRPLLERWLRLLPGEFIDKKPGLLVTRAFAYGLRWELDMVALTAQRALALIDKSDSSERTQILLGLIDVLEGQSFYHANKFESAVTSLREALLKLPAEWQYVRGVAGIYTGLSIHSSGHPEAAQRFLIGQYESYQDKGAAFSLRLLLAMAMNYIQSGNYENGERTARTILQQAVQSQLLVLEGWGYYLLGFVNYEWNELEKAAEYFWRVNDLFYTTQVAAARNGMIGLAYTTHALGRPADALPIIDKLSGIDLEARGQEQMDTTSARARLLLKQGNMEAVERWIHLDTFQLPDQSLLVWMEQPSLTKARILLARNKGSDTQMARQILDTIAELAERTANTRITIEVLALQALALLNQGDSAGARETLIRSVELARRGPFTRTFVDLGPQMQKLLNQIAGHESVAKSVSRILAAFPGAESTRGPVSLLPNLASTPLSDNSNDDELDEPLTRRELEVLLLMAEPISFREIASRMQISYTTARRYTINVYSKFGVHSRWEAVNSAIRKGIIAPR
jgi:LuxR family transcriptional regulator, maltose regulon positive regulatory protein